MPKWVVRSGEGLEWCKSKKDALALAERLASRHGWAEVCKVSSYSLPPVVVASY